jgi:hypothetical protein
VTATLLRRNTHYSRWGFCDLFRSYWIISKKLRHFRYLILSLLKCLYFFINHVRMIVAWILLLALVLPHLMQIIHLTQLLQRNQNFIWNIWILYYNVMLNVHLMLLSAFFKTANLNSLRGTNLDGNVKVYLEYLNFILQRIVKCTFNAIICIF